MEIDAATCALLVETTLAGPWLNKPRPEDHYHAVLQGIASKNAHWWALARWGWTTLINPARHGH